MKVFCGKKRVGDVDVFYREGGRPDAPVILLLHGFPTSGHMFRNLIPALADRYRVIAPDRSRAELSDECRALPALPAIFSRAPATAVGNLGQERSILHPARRRGLQIHFLDTGHFALETHCDEIAARMRDLLARHLKDG
jgi:pimeloyl-ACP methyl ester carboxylesterase